MVLVTTVLHNLFTCDYSAVSEADALCEEIKRLLSLEAKDGETRNCEGWNVSEATENSKTQASIKHLHCYSY